MADALGQVLSRRAGIRVTRGVPVRTRRAVGMCPGHRPGWLRPHLLSKKFADWHLQGDGEAVEYVD